MNLHPFKLYCVYLDPLNLSNVCDSSWSSISRTLSRFKKRKGNNLVLYEVSHKRVSHCGCAVDIQEIILKSVKHMQSCCFAHKTNIVS